ncbi:hypothetical protein [Longimicrobium sp.]|uniref:hypothetical protein n=1 Tax=Longimicrobium sp. TaxID=2029185 RepID=UPI002CB9F1DB|nr:hypothetical protein [Longimicrobium sp.]HSU16372.1 hypothetical protein [Longimicrobium sp.]
MEPMKPEEKARVLAENPQAEPGDLEEYERLLSRRFAMDPDIPASPEAIEAADSIEDRLAELHARLFPQKVPA